MKILTKKAIVEAILLQYPSARDNDNLLLSLIWKFQLREMRVYTMEMFFDLLAEGKLHHFESIRRCRQHLQEKSPYLRSKKYAERKDKLEKAVRDEIRAANTIEPIPPLKDNNGQLSMLLR